MTHASVQRVTAGLLLVLVLSARPSGIASPVQVEDLRPQMFRTAVEFMNSGNHQDAIVEFRRIIDASKTKPSDPIAGQAWLQLAQYYFDTAPDLEQAKQVTDALTTGYSQDQVVGPAAYLYSGRLALALARDAAARDRAYSQFKRATTYFRNHPYVSDALYYEAEARRMALESGQAEALFRQIATSYPRSPWAPKALLGQARCLVAEKNAPSAFAPLQRLRERYPDSPEAATARAWNTILYRLYLRSEPRYSLRERAIAGPAGKIEDVVALLAAPGGRLAVAGKAALYQFETGNGQQVQYAGAEGLKGLALDPVAGVIAVQKRAVLLAPRKALALSVPREGENKPLDDILSAVVTSRRELLVADKGRRGIFKFSMSGQFTGPFVDALADRMVIDASDRVAMLDRDTDTVTLVPAEGAKPERIPLPSNTGKPVDIAFDELGHLYVLVPEAGAVVIYHPNAREQLVRFSIPPKSPGAFRRGSALAVDQGGRIFVYEKSLERIQVYQ